MWVPWVFKIDVIQQQWNTKEDTLVSWSSCSTFHTLQKSGCLRCGINVSLFCTICCPEWHVHMFITVSPDGAYSCAHHGMMKPCMRRLHPPAVRTRSRRVYKVSLVLRTLGVGAEVSVGPARPTGQRGFTTPSRLMWCSWSWKLV